jgi:[ribosomal protein S5]-alanine N-acetyltransferase
MPPHSYCSSQLPQPPFSTERLVLRPYETNDATVVHQALDCDPEIWKFDPGFAYTVDQRRGVIARFAELRRQFGFAPCGAWLRDSGVFVGQGGLNPYINDYRDGTRCVEFEVMYKISRPFWRQGFATEIAQFWADFAFTHVRLQRLVVCPVKSNTPSLRVLAALGATFEDDWLDPNTTIATVLPAPLR